jgi:7-cyano-7-deazaguanine synthase
MSSPGKAVVLLSGGLDSTVTLALAKQQGFACCVLTIQYGQRHAVEIDAARRVARQLGAVQHIVLPIDLRQFGGSALTSDLDVPKDRPLDAMSEGIPITYVPARNTIFLSFALAWAEVLGASDIFLGVNVLDYSGYPDCRPEFIAAFEKLACLATKAGVEGTSFRIHTPLINWTKAEIIRAGVKLGIDFALTTSCYDPTPEGLACGHCDACQLRLKGFEENQMSDPRGYA